LGSLSRKAAGAVVVREAPAAPPPVGVVPRALVLLAPAAVEVE
jgi:hypothetical protein